MQDTTPVAAVFEAMRTWPWHRGTLLGDDPRVPVPPARICPARHALLATIERRAPPPPGCPAATAPAHSAV